MGWKLTSQHVKWAQEVQAKYGVPASVTLGQFIYESGAGTSDMAQQANNGFGVKGSGDAGSYYSRGSSWAKYSSMHESFLAYGKLLNNNRYTQHTKNTDSVKEYLQGLVKGGYCNDSDYVSNVMSIIKSNNLTQYDSYNSSWNHGVTPSDKQNGESKDSSWMHGVDPTYNPTTSDGSDSGFFTGVAMSVVKVVFILVLVILGVLFVSQAFRG